MTSNGELFYLWIEDTTSVARVKYEIKKRTEIPVNDQRLSRAGETLSDGRTLTDSDGFHNSMLHLYVLPRPSKNT